MQPLGDDLLVCSARDYAHYDRMWTTSLATFRVIKLVMAGANPAVAVAVVGGSILLNELAAAAVAHCFRPG